MVDELDFEHLLQLSGGFGLYQWILCSFFWGVAAPALAFAVFGHFLLLLTPDHWCRTSSLEGGDKDLWIPLETTEGGAAPQFSRCRVYNQSILVSNASAVTECRDGWEYNYASVYPTVISEWDLVCDKAWLGYLAHTAFWAGGAVGAVLFGRIADRLGRRPVILLTHTMCGAFGLATNFFGDVTAFIAGRALIGFAVLPMSMAPYVLVLEYVSTDWRLTVSTVYLFVYSVVGCLVPWMAYYIGNWRTFNLVFSTFAFVVPLSYRFVPESLRWLIANNHAARARVILKTIAKVNCVEMEDDISLFQVTHKPRRESVAAMIRLPNLRKIYILTIFTWILMSVCYMGGYVYAAAVSDNPFLMISVNSAMDLVANGVADRLAVRFGRRATMASNSALSSITFFISCSDLVKAHPWGRVITLMASRVTLTTAYNVNYLYGAEVYPTVVRSQALSIRQALGAVGSFLSPQIVYLSVYSRPLPLLVFGCLALLAAGLSLMLPETLNVKLPETLSDGETLGQTRLFSPTSCCDKNSETPPTTTALPA